MAVILIIDDDASVRGLLMAVLHNLGHESVAAAGGEDGVALMGTRPFDLVITDLRMPRVDGLQVIREFQRRSPGTPVLLMSGLATADDPTVPVLHKPFSREKL